MQWHLEKKGIVLVLNWNGWDLILSFPWNSLWRILSLHSLLKIILQKKHIFWAFTSFFFCAVTTLMKVPDTLFRSLGFYSCFTAMELLHLNSQSWEICNTHMKWQHFVILHLEKVAQMSPREEHSHFFPSCSEIDRWFILMVFKS